MNAIDFTKDVVSISEDEMYLYIGGHTFMFRPVDGFACHGCAFRKHCATMHLSPIVMCGGDNYPREDESNGIWEWYSDPVEWTLETADNRTDDEKAMAELILG
jgi:hypothetical protein